MLGKLIKHDFRATARVFLPVIIGFIGMSIINKFSFELEMIKTTNSRLIDTLSILFMTLYIISTIALAVVTQIFVAMHFYKTMTGEQGYLTHTLPVKNSTVINSKLLVAIFWQVISGIVIIASIILLFAGHVTVTQLNTIITEMNNALFDVIHMNLGTFLLELSLLFFIGIISSTLMYYVSIAIGHLYHKHRLGAAIVAFFVIYFIIQILSSILGTVLGIMSFDQTVMSSFWLLYQKIMGITGAASIVTCIIFYVVTNYIFTKKLNME